jgi:DNA-3-methyladenine glycosylase
VGRHPRSPVLSDERLELLALPAPEVAPLLLGWRLTARGAGETVTVVLTEVEAYQGAEDPASHAYRGQTRRNATMFGPPGRLYVYLSHGLHLCANIVCGPEGVASAVLLRAGRVVDGVDVARRRRAQPSAGRPPRGPIAVDALARGPGSLGRALGLRREDDGEELSRPGGRLELCPSSGPTTAAELAAGPRVGVSAAADRPWRHWLVADPTVSGYRRSPRATARPDVADPPEPGPGTE